MGKSMGKSLGGPIGALYPNAVGSNPSAVVANAAMRLIFKKRTLSDLEHKTSDCVCQERRTLVEGNAPVFAAGVNQSSPEGDARG